ncbi:MAG: DUF2339 domain-containing protein [Planctomycetes bacterium]|nr:DUF2339 domain-containing protein [Planctomycetota bacterium]
MQERCPTCGLDLTVLRSLDDLRSAVRQAQSDSEVVANRLRELQRQVLSLEPMIVTQLTSPPAAPPHEQSLPEAEQTAPPASCEVSVTGEEAVKVDTAPPQSLEWTAPVAPPAAKRSPVLSGTAEVRLGQKWLLIAGLVITVLAVGYFLKYSFDRNWIGPAGRVALAYLAGIAMLGVGEFFRRRKLKLFGLYLLGGGIAVLYFASYAAFQIYDLIGQLPAFGLMALVTALAGVLSLYHDTKWLAVLGIIGGFLTPVILSTGTDNQIALMGYMAILNGGILAIAGFKQWHLLNYLGLTFTWMLFSAWYFRHYADPKFWTTTVFLNVFFLIHAVVPFVYYFARKSRQQVTGFGITIPNSFMAFGFSFAMVRSHFSLEMVSVVSIAYAAVFLGMATYLRRRNRENVDAFILLLAKGLLFLIITVPILFSEHWITVFWAAQGVVLLWAALRLGDVRLRSGAIVLLLIAAAKLVVHDYPVVFELRVLDMYYRDGFTAAMFERWVTIALVLGVLFRSAQMFKAAGFDRGDRRENWTAFFFGLFGILLFVVMNIEVAAGFHDYLPRARFASISVLWALFATALLILGFVRNKALLRRCSIVLFAATIIKVFVRDTANVDTPYRILSFLVLGLMLVGASYLYHRFTSRILPAGEELET